MNRLNPNKLYVEYRNGVTMTGPVGGRKCTLTHSDDTADLFLTIGKRFAYDKLTAMRDEVLAEWQIGNGCLFLQVNVLVDSQQGLAQAAERSVIFRRELPLALEAIRYGDRVFFASNPALDDVPICIYFDSKNPEYRGFENWGTPSHYR